MFSFLFKFNFEAERHPTFNREVMNGSGGASTSNVAKEAWLDSIKKELGKVHDSKTKGWSICTAPSTLRYNNSEAFCPKIISIGPIHHGRQDLESMEKHKLDYAISFFRRTSNPDVALEACNSIILGLLDDILANYEEAARFKASFGKEKLVRIFLIDGCFILELFLTFSSTDPMLHKDPIFSYSWMIPTLQRDLALLENQIPFVLLNLLFNLTVRHSSAETTNVLHELALRFFQSALSVDEETIRTTGRRSCNHLLDLIHNCYIPTQAASNRQGKGPSEVIRNAKALNEAGIKLKSYGVKNLVDVEYENGVIRLPKFVIHDMTDTLFWNLLALEQCCRRDAEYISSYVLLMDLLVNTNEDVELLERSGIIKSYMADRDRISNFLNNIGKQVLLQDFYYAGLCDEVDKYYNNRIVQLTSFYFRHPSAFIALIFASLLFLAIVSRALFTMLGYYQIASIHK